MRFVLPDPSEKHVVAFLRDHLALSADTMLLQIKPETGCRSGDCFVNVRRKVQGSGGTLHTGWALWERSGLYIEAEHHAVYDHEDGTPLLDITPCSDGFTRRLFVSDPEATFDFERWDLRDNKRMALVDDDIVRELFKSSSKINAFKASLPGRGVAVLRPFEQRELAKLQRRCIRANQELEFKYGR